MQNMTTNHLSIDECKVMWIIGATERLASLGYLNPDIPLRLSSSAIEDYMMIDEYRDQLFESDFEIADIFRSIAFNNSTDEPNEYDVKCVVDLILEYKNNRYNIVKSALTNNIG